MFSRHDGSQSVHTPSVRRSVHRGLMQACNFPKQSDRVECRCSQAGMVQREPEFSFGRGSDLLVRIPFHHESSVPEVPSASVGPDPRGRNRAGHQHAGHYPRHHGARGAEKGTQLAGGNPGRNSCRVGKGRPAGSIELRVSPSPSKIPYGGFSTYGFKWTVSGDLRRHPGA